ncbi:unnamed protein product [Oikopleura dioica]|uniref:Uncharacterized protein n=1 Tax=Oikopleura dioica TaxID=34765 RepID=E4YC38_OIKDI|nr:unnamed protein product [Oikopleura dioica]
MLGNITDDENKFTIARRSIGAVIKTVRKMVRFLGIKHANSRADKEAFKSKFVQRFGHFRRTARATVRRPSSSRPELAKSESKVDPKSQKASFEFKQGAKLRGAITFRDYNGFHFALVTVQYHGLVRVQIRLRIDLKLGLGARILALLFEFHTQPCMLRCL